MSAATNSEGIRRTLHLIVDAALLADDAVDRGDEAALDRALTIAEAHIAAIRAAMQPGLPE